LVFFTETHRIDELLSLNTAFQLIEVGRTLPHVSLLTTITVTVLLKF